MDNFANIPDVPETSYDRDHQNERRRQEVLGPTHHINATQSFGPPVEEPVMSRGEEALALLGYDWNRSAELHGQIEIPRQTLRLGEGYLEGRISTAGVDPLANFEQPEGKYIGGVPQVEVVGAEEQMQAAESAWKRRTARHRPMSEDDPRHPRNNPIQFGA